ncbi:MAG TPA: glycosyltransferase family 4 protein [Acidimicrobiales bacterium]|nr:glycosyltransferase family 4 protein [Acidimicrobiales bacterium]
MRIAQVCPYSLSSPGGVQGQVTGLSRVLAGMGHHVEVVAPCDGPPPNAQVRPVGTSVRVPANGSQAPVALSPACALRTVAALHDGDFDVVHLQEPLVPAPCLSALLASRRPLIGTFHRSGAGATYRMLGPLLGRLLDRLSLRVAVSPQARTTARDHLGGEYRLAFNAVDIEPFSSAVPTPTEGPTIFFIGRHEPRKGLGILLEAFATLPDDVRLWVASDGPQTQELRSRYGADGRIRWLGRVSDQERASRLRGADVVCAPSLRGESFGMVVLEAMAAGRPLVVSDLAGYRSVATDRKDALMVPPGDAAALAAALREVLGDPGLAQALGARGRERAEGLSMRRLAELYLDLYDEARR